VCLKAAKKRRNSKGLRSTRLFSGLTSKLESGLSKAIGREVSVGSGHVTRRVIERMFTEGGALAGVSVKQLGKTLNKGEFYKDAVTGSFMEKPEYRLGAGLAILRFVESRSTGLVAGCANCGSICLQIIQIRPQRLKKLARTLRKLDRQRRSSYAEHLSCFSL
jgi:hypothetical protein